MCTQRNKNVYQTIGRRQPPPLAAILLVTYLDLPNRLFTFTSAETKIHLRRNDILGPKDFCMLFVRRSYFAEIIQALAICAVHEHECCIVTVLAVYRPNSVVFFSVNLLRQSCTKLSVWLKAASRNHLSLSDMSNGRHSLPIGTNGVFLSVRRRYHPIHGGLRKHVCPKDRRVPENVQANRANFFFRVHGRDARAFCGEARFQLSPRLRIMHSGRTIRITTMVSDSRKPESPDRVAVDICSPECEALVFSTLVGEPSHDFHSIQI